MRKQWIPGPFLSPREKGLGTRLGTRLIESALAQLCEELTNDLWPWIARSSCNFDGSSVQQRLLNCYQHESDQLKLELPKYLAAAEPHSGHNCVVEETCMRMTSHIGQIHVSSTLFGCGRACFFLFYRTVLLILKGLNKDRKMFPVMYSIRTEKCFL